jgi:hypothetical protein
MKKQSTIGPGHDGKPKSGFFAKPGESGLEVHHTPAFTSGMKRQNVARGHVALDGAPKRHLDVSVHSGMTRNQRDTAGLGGIAHGAVVDGGQPAINPLQRPAPKRILPARGAHGHATLDPEHAARVLASGLPTAPNFRGKDCRG